MNNFDPLNPAGFNYGNQGQTNSWGQPRQYGGYAPPAQPQPQLITNAIFVTSLEEALIKTTERPSDMIYFHQDKSEFYRIKVDTEGKKTWAVFNYNVPKQDDNIPATKADIQMLLSRIEILEEARNTKVAPKRKKEVTENAESDGSNTVFAFDTP